MSKAKREYKAYNEVKYFHTNKSCWICENYINELEEQKKEMKSLLDKLYCLESLNDIHNTIEKLLDKYWQENF